MKKEAHRALTLVNRRVNGDSCTSLLRVRVPRADQHSTQLANKQKNPQDVGVAMSQDVQ
jgi:hypothetical protein